MKTKKALLMLLSTCALVTSLSAFAGNEAPDPVSEGLAKIAEPRMKALADVASKDKDLGDRMATYRRDARAILSDRSLKESERQKQLAELSKKIEPTVKTLFSKAKIDEKAYKSEGEEHIKRHAKGRQYTAQYLGYLGWFWKYLPKKPKEAIKPDVEVRLSAPYPFDQKTRNGDGEVSTDKTAGKYVSEAAISWAGAHDNSAGLAHFHQLSESFRRVQVFAALPETQWRADAFSDIFAVFGSSARSRIEVFANNRVICSEEVEHASILAPVIAIIHRSGTDNIVVNCEVAAPSRDDEIVIRATSVAGAWGGGLGYASAKVTATPRDIRLLLKR